MAIDSYIVFQPYTGSPLAAESQVDMSKNNEELASDLKGMSRRPSNCSRSRTTASTSSRR